MNFEMLEALGRERLSQNFFMREFLYSEIANWHRLRNVPNHPEVALRVARKLCTELLEPLQMRFGRIHVRSGYRSPEVNAFGNQNDLNCASNENNYAEHIWDCPDANGHCGATACIVVPALADYIAQGGSWTAMAWWIHDHLPYSSLCFFSKLGAFNIGWHEAPRRRIDSYAAPRGCLTKPQMANHAGEHLDEYKDLLTFVDKGVFHPQLLKEGPTGAKPKNESQRPGAREELPTYTRGADGSGSKELIRYRAVHTKTKWRRVNTHASMDNAIHGRDGAAGLFTGRVRINHERHGEPLFVVVWRDGDQHGKVIRPDTSCVGKLEIAIIPIQHIEDMEASGGGTTIELARYFT